jgi:hypothetical protein
LVGVVDAVDAAEVADVSRLARAAAASLAFASGERVRLGSDIETAPQAVGHAGRDGRGELLKGWPLADRSRARPFVHSPADHGV